MKLGYNKIKPERKVKAREVSQYARIDGYGREARNPLEALRRSLQMTQEQFANQLGLSKQVIQYYESGQRSPTPRTWAKMKETALQNGIILTDEILYSLVGEKLEKRRERIYNEIKNIDSVYNRRIDTQEITTRDGGQDECV